MVCFNSNYELFSQTRHRYRTKVELKSSPAQSHEILSAILGRRLVQRRVDTVNLYVTFFN